MLCYVTPDVRDYAAKLELDEQQALGAGMEAKSAEFRERGGEVYVAAGEVATGD